MDWTNIQKSITSEILNKAEAKNTSFSYVASEWGSVKNVEVSVRHRFELDECVNGIVGCSFTLEDVPKFHIEIEHDEGKIEFGKEFRQELMNKFIFSSEQAAQRNRTLSEVISMPPAIPPMFEIQVSTMVYTGSIKIPFKATFNSGNRVWTMPGVYTGYDSTNVKLMFNE